MLRAFVSLSMIMLGFYSAIAQYPGVGDPAPDFTHQSLDHGQITLSNYRGKVVMLYFIGYS